MERFSRRNVAGDAGDSSDSASTGGRARRRRGEPEERATASDDAETDSSSVAASQSQGQSQSQSRQRRRSSARKAAEETRKAHEREGRSGLRSSHEDEENEEGEEEETHSSGEGKHAHAHAHEPKRERSLSNLSTTSSTSASSLASEPLSEEARVARMAQQLEELQQKKHMVEDGTLAEFCRRVTEFKEERNRLLQTAELHKNLQLKNGQDLYGFEVQRAHHLWQHGKDVLRNDLLTRLDGVQSLLQKELDALEASGAMTTTTSTRPSKDSNGEAAHKRVHVMKLSDKSAVEPKTSGEEAEADEAELSRATKRYKPAEPEVFPEQAVRLPLDDITADLAAIAGERKQVAQATHAKLEAMGVVAATTGLKLERRRLLVGKWVFEDGDEVTLLSPLVQEHYTGTISSITDDAVYLKLASGQKVRVFLPLLERRRCELKPLLRGSSATGTLQTAGWTECEPF